MTDRAHSTPPTIDSDPAMQIITPKGLILTLPPEHLPDIVRERLREENGTRDTRAAIAMARLTGLDCTVRRVTQTTVRAADCD